MERAEGAENSVDQQCRNVQAEHTYDVQVSETAMQLRSLGHAEDDQPENEGKHLEANVYQAENSHRE